MNHYEPRKLYRKEKENNYLFHDSSNEGFKLEDLIHSETKMLILGSPGIGKSTELRVLFEKLWDDRVKNQLIPLSINLKFFRKNDSFEDFIQVENWQEIPQITFILDGLDEVADIQDLISALEVFINKHSKKNYRYVLSCRTNIYHKYLVEFSDFKTFYLHSLSEYQAESILTNEFDIPYSKIEKFPFLKGYFESPFFINRFAELIKKRDDDLTYLSLWQDYIQFSLEADKNKFKKRDLFIVSKMTATLRKAAITLELMHKNTLNESELVQIFDNQIDTAQQLSLFKLDSKNAQYSFTHKQTQEYLVASSLINLNIDKILETIKMPEVEAVHPSFQNTLTFLLDLIEHQETFTKLIDWVKNNQIDILFSIDSNRLQQDVKEAIFQSYFEEICIKQTLWITTNRSVSISQIASFANTPKIHDYLVRIIKDSKQHFRARQSAVIVLFEFLLPKEINESLKKFITQYLQDENREIGLASDLIQLSVEQQFYKNKIFTKSLFELVQHSSNAQLNREVLKFIECGFDHLELDQFSDFLDKEFRWSHKVDKREDRTDKTIRGNGDSCWRIISRLDNFELFNKYLTQYLNDELSNSYITFPKAQIIERAVIFFKDDGNYFKFLSGIKNSYRFHERSDFLVEITEKSYKQKEAIEYLAENKLVDDFYFFIIKIIKKESIQTLAKHIANTKNDEKGLAWLRFHLSRKSKNDLAFQLENSLVKLGMSFEESLKTDAEIEENRKAENERYRKDFDDLFDKRTIKKKVQDFFEQNGSKLNWKEYYQVKTQWYEKNGYHKKLPIYYELISDALRPSDESKQQDFEVVWKYLDTEIPIYSRILAEYSQAQGKEINPLEITDSQKDQIESWSIKKVEDIDFDNIKHSKNSNFYLIEENWSLFKLIHELFKVFSLNLPQSFLLDSLEFYEIQRFENQEEKSYDRIKLAINEDEKFNNQIIEDLKNKVLFDTVLKNHVEYAINHNLEDTYTQIEDYVLSHTSLLFFSDVVTEFLVKTKRISTIKKIAEKSDTWEGWRAVKLLLKNNIELNYIIKHSIDFLENEKESRFRGDALNVLFKTNHHEAVQYLVNEVRKEKNYKFDYLKDTEYSEFVNVAFFDELFEICYIDEFDSFEQHYARSFYRNWLRNLVKKDFKKVKFILEGILKKQTELNRDLFYINVLIEEITNAYILNKSKPYSLKEAIYKAEEILEL